MGRKQDSSGGGGDHTLSVNVPSLFRCPISLDVMKSPVSLCTGVTYDRSSIQRWLDSGHTTCPATMQPLPSTDLIPNLTLHRLISLWAGTGPHSSPSLSLLADIRSSSAAKDPLTSLRNLAQFFANTAADDYDKTQLLAAPGFVETLKSFLHNDDLEISEAAVAVFCKILGSASDDDDNRENRSILIKSASLSRLLRILRRSKSLDARSDAVVVIDAVVSATEFKDSLAQNTELIRELIRLLNEEEELATIHNALSSLLQLSSVRRVRAQFVELGIVKTLGRVLNHDELPVPAAEKAMKLLEAVSACRDGRAAICADAETVIAAVMRRMMRVGRGGREAAVVVLWSVCHLFRDRRAQEAVEASGGLTKMLVVMQSDCSPAIRQMAGDLIKIFRVNAQGCLAGYDTNTKHIMPF